MQHNCMFLNSHGDINISWSEDDHNQMKNLILKKMDEGYLFFVLEKKWFGLKKKTSQLNSANFNKLIDKKEIIIRDEDLDVFVKQANSANISNSNTEGAEFDVKKTLTKDDVVNNTDFKEDTQLVATKPPVAG